jgi:hypothetical protein
VYKTQGLAVCESVLQHLSEVSGVPLDVLKLKNLYKEGDRTHFGQRLELFAVPSLWAKIYTLVRLVASKPIKTHQNPSKPIHI